MTGTPAGASPPLARVVAALERAGCRRGGPRGGWQCPAHEDHTPSLSVHEGTDGRALLHCHAGCQPEQVAAALGLTMPDLFPEPDHDQADDDWTPRGPAIAPTGIPTRPGGCYSRSAAPPTSNFRSGGQTRPPRPGGAGA
jgi:hypothetical protein